MGRAEDGKYRFQDTQVEENVRECCEGYQPSANQTTCEPAVLLANDTNWFIGFVIVGILALAAVSLVIFFGYRHKVAADKAKKEHTVKYTVDSAEASDEEDVETTNRVFRPDFVTPSTSQPNDVEKPNVEKKQQSSSKMNEYVELGNEAHVSSSNEYDTISPRQSHPASFDNPNLSTQPLLNKE
ncbi:hypothetical protein M3Y94_00559900 [Aphelenchoides besseyi]|nr:hypothetical protein M3Y94_00559900 [Aphelenchoides besseyi]